MFYLKSGKTAFTSSSKRVSDSAVKYHAMNIGVIAVHPEAIRDGTVDPKEDFPAGVEVIITSVPPEGAVVLRPAPKGWAVEE